MTTCFVPNHYFSKARSEMQKCRLRRLISENTRKTTSDQGFAYLQKDGEYIQQEYVVHENTG